MCCVYFCKSERASAFLKYLGCNYWPFMARQNNKNQERFPRLSVLLSPPLFGYLCLLCWPACQSSRPLEGRSNLVILPKWGYSNYVASAAELSVRWPMVIHHRKLKGGWWWWGGGVILTDGVNTSRGKIRWPHPRNRENGR